MTLLTVDEELHVWLIELEGHGDPNPPLDETLSSEEKLRAVRFVSERDRRCFVVAHSALRQILSMYVGVSPSAIAFEIGRYGKPALCGVPGTKIRFNLSHSGAVALCAIASDCDVGVDIEQIQSPDVVVGVAEQFFSAAEQRLLAGIDVDARAEAFTRVWVRKEACLKAAGRGISGDVSGFSVTLDDTDVSVPTSDERGAIWALRELVAPRGYFAAAATSVPLPVRAWRFGDLQSPARTATP